MKTTFIYFSDLNEKGQKKILEVTGAKNAEDLNMDLDIIPLFIYEVEEDV